jgi:hypothetical protein
MVCDSSNLSSQDLRAVISESVSSPNVADCPTSPAAVPPIRKISGSSARGIRYPLGPRVGDKGGHPRSASPSPSLPGTKCGHADGAADFSGRKTKATDHQTSESNLPYAAIGHGCGLLSAPVEL